MRDYLPAPQNYCAGERAIFRAPILSLSLAAVGGVFALVRGMAGWMGERRTGRKPLVYLMSLCRVLPVRRVHGCGCVRARMRRARGRARALLRHSCFYGEQGEHREQGKKE